MSVPFLFLAGLLRIRLARTTATQLLQETGESPPLEEARGRAAAPAQRPDASAARPRGRRRFRRHGGSQRRASAGLGDRGRHAARVRGRADRRRRPRSGAAGRARAARRRPGRRARGARQGPKRPGAPRERAAQPRAPRRDPGQHVPDPRRRDVRRLPLEPAGGTVPPARADHRLADRRAPPRGGRGSGGWRRSAA